MNMHDKTKVVLVSHLISELLWSEDIKEKHLKASSIIEKTQIPSAEKCGLVFWTENSIQERNISRMRTHTHPHTYTFQVVGY